MKRIIYILIILLIPLTGHTQTEKQLVPSDLKQLTIVTEPSTLYKGFFRAGLALSYGVVDKYFTNNNKKEYFLNSAWATNSGYSLLMQYGITDRLQIEASVPFINDLRQSQSKLFAPMVDSTIEYSYSLKGRGIGDCYFTLKYQVFQKTETKMSLTGSLDLTIPTGEKNPTNIEGPTSYDPPVGNGYFASAIGLKLKKIQYPYSFTGYFYYTYKFPGAKILDPSDTDETEFKDGNHLDAGASFNFHLNEWIALTNEINFYSRAKDEINKEVPDDAVAAFAASYEPRLVFQIKKFRIGEAIRIPLIGRSVSADPLYILITQYVF